MMHMWRLPPSIPSIHPSSTARGRLVVDGANFGGRVVLFDRARSLRLGALGLWQAVCVGMYGYDMMTIIIQHPSCPRRAFI